MTLLVLPFDAGCGLRCFEINERTADYEDFGEYYDAAPSAAPEYGCGDRRFIPKPATNTTLEKYDINTIEYDLICDRLSEALSIGRCERCV